MRPADADQASPPDHRSGCCFEGRSPHADHCSRSPPRSGPAKDAPIRIQPSSSSVILLRGLRPPPLGFFLFLCASLLLFVLVNVVDLVHVVEVVCALFVCNKTEPHFQTKTTPTQQQQQQQQQPKQNKNNNQNNKTPEPQKQQK